MGVVKTEWTKFTTISHSGKKANGFATKRMHHTTLYEESVCIRKTKAICGYGIRDEATTTDEIY